MLGKQFARGAFSSIHSVPHPSPCAVIAHADLQATSLKDGEVVAVKRVPLEEDDEIQEVPTTSSTLAPLAITHNTRLAVKCSSFWRPHILT